MPNKFAGFFKDVKVEMTKVSWPTRNELTGSTSVVIIAVILLAILIGLWDFVLSSLVNVLIR
ncbi:MAG: preprotein translocase subunit SecE [Candidatus Omnitrophica bacterium CG07_land_8_20_14_0_80_42_15]|uniref:Protein translocase subunit SecE n=1 Tax=Candidatus Aquitaenariimonas noxiae TaxID=1974741 RepID=A0A2J0L598_9BACT|nr:MAG: preprotein translocase subunit SecE [Candidatus Omnitrophica bacterium CG07_land_8_20_14_0_80_42_15]